MKVDERGNLYSAGPGGIWIFSADGKHLGTIDIGVVGNLAWGGPDYKTLFVMAGPAIYSIRLQVRVFTFAPAKVQRSLFCTRSILQ